MIIDFHTHPYLTWEQNLCMYREAYSLSPIEQQEQLKKAGITKICGSVIMPVKSDLLMETIRECNRSAIKMKDLWGEFYLPGIHIHPFYIEESCMEIQWAAGNGIHLIGELVPYFHGWKSYEEKGLSEILDCAGQYHMIISYHSSDADVVDRMIEEHPEIPFVAAHPGERVRLEQHIRRMKKYPNLYLDLSGTGLFRFGMLKYMVDQVGSERILFGTDYPICNPGMYVQAVMCEEIKESDRENIFWRNAERLFASVLSDEGR